MYHFTISSSISPNPKPFISFCLHLFTRHQQNRMGIYSGTIGYQLGEAGSGMHRVLWCIAYFGASRTLVHRVL